MKPTLTLLIALLLAPLAATWQRTGRRLKHRNGLVEEAFAEGTEYRIRVPQAP